MLQSKSKIRHSLLTRLLVSHILIVSLPLFITGKVLVDTAQDSIKETILARNLEFAIRSTRFIDLQLSTARDLIKSQAKFQSIFPLNRSTQELAINTLVNEFDLFNQLSILDTLGHVIASTSFDDVASKKISSNGLVTSIISSFRYGNGYETPVYISEAERLPMLDIAEPIKLYNEVAGILYAIVDLKAMWDIVDENKIGQRGEAFIFDQDGVFIAHSDRKNVYSKKRFLNRQVVDRIQKGESGQMIYQTEQGTEMVAAYAPVGGYGWGAMLQQPTSEAFAPARRMRFRVIQFMVISVLLASMLAYFYSKLIVTPVNRLVSGMERFSRGELSYRITEVTDDEIGALAKNFNRMAERLIEFQNRLKRAEVLETLSKLASVLSHEIRNPLNSMVINMQILKRELSRDRLNKERVEKFYGILETEIKRVDQLVSDFLLIARPPKTEKSEVAINEIIDEVVMTQVADSLNKGVRIEREYLKSPIRTHVDASKIRQVFLNLTINAIQAMPGGGRLKIVLREAGKSSSPLRKKSVVVSFSDTGHGIKKENLARIFDFYYSTKDEGTGIGLAIVQQIVDEHQGRISVKSTVGKGTTFTVYLPNEYGAKGEGKA